MELFFHILIMMISFYLLAVICDRYFVYSLDQIAEKLKMNSDMAGATLMAIGSSAPELFISFIALFHPGNESIGAGTIVGSAIFNILVIIGAAAMVKKAFIAWQPIVRDTIFYSLSIILLVVSFWDGKITLLEASLFIILYIIYVISVLKWEKIMPYKDKNEIPINNLKETPREERKTSYTRSLFSQPFKLINIIIDLIFPNKKKYWSNFILSIIFIAALSWVLVESAVMTAQILNIPAVIIGLTVLAIGTSVPDLVSSVIVARQGRSGMAISNAIGSNIFDILIGLGLPWAIITFGGKIVPVATENLINSIILLFASVITVLIFLISRRWRIGRLAGISLISIYLIYVTWNVWQII